MEENITEVSSDNSFDGSDVDILSIMQNKDKDEQIVNPAKEFDEETYQSNDAESNNAQTTDDKNIEIPAMEVKYPVSWDKEGRSRFDKLSPEDQQYIIAQDQRRETYANGKAQYAAKVDKLARESLTKIQEDYYPVYRELMTELYAIRNSVDMDRLMETDPQSYVMAKKAYDKVEYLRQVARHKLDSLEAASQDFVSETTPELLRDEVYGLIPKLKEYFPNKDGKAIVTDLISFASDLGISQKELVGINKSYHVELLALAKIGRDFIMKAKPGVKQDVVKGLLKSNTHRQNKEKSKDNYNDITSFFK